MVDVVVVVVVEESESILGQPFRKILMQHTLLHIHRAVFSKLNYHLQCNGAVHYTHFTYGRLVSIYSGSSTHICCKKNYVVLTCQVTQPFERIHEKFKFNDLFFEISNFLYDAFEPVFIWVIISYGGFPQPKKFFGLTQYLTRALQLLYPFRN